MMIFGFGVMVLGLVDATVRLTVYRGSSLPANPLIGIGVMAFGAGVVVCALRHAEPGSGQSTPPSS